jgi:hypothetical protein
VDDGDQAGRGLSFVAADFSVPLAGVPKRSRQTTTCGLVANRRHVSERQRCCIEDDRLIR